MVILKSNCYYKLYNFINTKYRMAKLKKKLNNFSINTFKLIKNYYLTIKGCQN